MKRLFRALVPSLALLAALFAGCTEGPAGEHATPSPDSPEDMAVQVVNQTFELIVTEANVADSLRSAHGSACIVVQPEDEGAGEAKVVGRAVAEWSPSPPNPASLRFGWFDADHRSDVPSVSGPSPLTVEFDGTAGWTPDTLLVFVGTTDGSPLVAEQRVTVRVDLTAVGAPVRLYASSCAVSD